MLIKDFYQIKQLQAEEREEYTARIALNAKHAIFKGHFPNNPVMPGVCMMQVIKELVEKVTEEKLFMQQISNVKFLSLINPEKSDELVVNFQIQKNEDERVVKVKSNIHFQDTLALRMNSTYKLV